MISIMLMAKISKSKEVKQLTATEILLMISMGMLTVSGILVEVVCLTP